MLLLLKINTISAHGVVKCARFDTCLVHTNSAHHVTATPRTTRPLCPPHIRECKATKDLTFFGFSCMTSVCHAKDRRYGYNRIVCYV
jgi:hypothetical protein